MVGLNAIGGVPVPANTNASRMSSGRGNVVTESTGDLVTLSQQSRAASRLAQVVEQAKAQNAVREQQVSQARAKVEDGTYKMQEMVRIVAARVSRYIRVD